MITFVKSKTWLFLKSGFKKNKQKSSKECVLVSATLTKACFWLKFLRFFFSSQ